MKYIFTESQVKKIIDNQLNEQQTSVGSSVTSSISHMVSGKKFYSGMTNGLRRQNFTVVLVNSGKPTISIEKKGIQLLTKGMKILNTNLLTFKPGDEIQAVSDSNSHVIIYAKNGLLMFDGMGA